ncbi:uncharacterized protein cd8b [Syngnathoides biaculeatus]|uniref:uncharacterized protein cd8b n=1 Tax=Syngnathoides biaculeatus TaxID=300417 RepID=UPI002ADD397D|nr:uncharacterized protein cd8b [Syngnathoides biaculeatus]
MGALAPEVILISWTLLTPCLQSLDLGQIPQPAVMYPQLLSTAFIQCKCDNISCESVFWFRTISKQNKVQFLGKVNSANRPSPGDNTDDRRFQLSRKSSALFILQIFNVTEEDTGTYSCILKDRKNQEVWLPGVLLLPGEQLPTKPPQSTPRLICSCSENLAGDCDSLILWSLVGLAAVLVMTLTCSLYYFSRLPKKCKHRFVKWR